MSVSENRISRREFISRSAAGAALVAVGNVGFAPSRAIGANERINVGIIGAGTQGSGLMRQVLSLEEDLNVQVAAICDTWRINREKAVATVVEQSGREPKQFTDFEELLALSDIDAVVIATPDFSHCPILSAAIKSGKDAFIEKPLSFDLQEANEVLDVVKASDRVVQVGTQRRSEGRWKAVVSAVQEGVLGKITRIEIGWNDNKPRWKRGVDECRLEDVDYERFKMGRIDKPFSPHRYRQWQLYRDMTTGPIGILGSHYIDVVHWIMNDPYPDSAVAHGGIYIWNDGREHEDTLYVIYDYPSGFMCRLLIGLGNSAESGCRIYGTKGMFREQDWAFTGAGGRSEFAIKEEIKVVPEEDEGHIRGFLQSVRSRKQPNTPIEAGYQHAVGTVLGYQALRTGKKLKYLPATREIVEA